MLCIDSLAECTGCGRCTDAPLICSECSSPIADAKKYILLFGRPVCLECMETVAFEGEECLLCREDTKGGIRYKRISLCPACLQRRMRYAGYC